MKTLVIEHFNGNGDMLKRDIKTAETLSELHLISMVITTLVQGTFKPEQIGQKVRLSVDDIIFYEAEILLDRVLVTELLNKEILSLLQGEASCD